MRALGADIKRTPKDEGVIGAKLKQEATPKNTGQYI